MHSNVESLYALQNAIEQTDLDWNFMRDWISIILQYSCLDICIASPRFVYWPRVAIDEVGSGDALVRLQTEAVALSFSSSSS